MLVTQCHEHRRALACHQRAAPSPTSAPVASIATSIGEPCRPPTNVWCSSSVPAYATVSANAHAKLPVARSRSTARIAYSVACAHLRSTRSQVPSPELRLGTDENAKITAAQTTTVSQRVTIAADARLAALTGERGGKPGRIR